MDQTADLFFSFPGVNLQLKAGYHYIKNITEPTRAQNLILQVLCPPVRAQGLWSPLQQTQLCNQSDSIMQINSSIFYSQFRSHHSALSWSLVFQSNHTGIMPCLWKSQRMGTGSSTATTESRFFPRSTPGAKHKLVVVTSAQVQNTQQRCKTGIAYVTLFSNTKFKC